MVNRSWVFRRRYIWLLAAMVIAGGGRLLGDHHRVPATAHSRSAVAAAAAATRPPVLGPPSDLALRLASPLETPALEAVSVAGPERSATVKVSEGPLAGVRVYVPARAVREPMTIDVRLGGSVELPTGALAIGPAADLGPDGARFLLPVEVTLPFDAALVGEGRELAVFHFEDATGERTRLPVRAVDHERGLVTTATDRFSTVVVAAVPVPWWDSWPRFSNARKAARMQTTSADVATAAANVHDEGVGPLWREAGWQNGRAELDKIHQGGMRGLAWIENWGQARHIIAAVNKRPDGTYEQDPRTGATKIIAHNWTWDSRDPARGNEIVWAGIHSYVNEEAWLGPLTRRHPLFGLPAPTYPDGRSALGYVGDPSDPINARFYDALASKAVDGAIHVSPHPLGTRYDGKLAVQLRDGTTVPCGDFSVGKDSAASWWVDYQQIAARYFLDRGVDGFWLDNTTGFDSFGPEPVERAFGEWSVAGFRDFLAAHPQVGVGATASFDVRSYLRDRLRAWYPGADPGDLKHRGWSDPRWLDDPVWCAYLVYKSELSHRGAQGLHDLVKSAAAAAGLANPDDAYVGGNDIPSLSFAAIRGEEVDTVNTEMGPGWSLSTGPVGRGLAPHGGAGAFYAAATRFGRSRHAVVWHYLDGPYAPLASRRALGEVVGFEALACNTLLNSGGRNGRIAGDDASAARVNAVVERLEPVLGRRRRAGRVALLYSTETQLARFTPGGPVDFSRPAHNLGYYGWGAALERLRIPYRAIPDFRLSPVELQGVSLLVLPHVLAITRRQVDDVLVPFVRAGGAIVVTGSESGSQDTQEGLYASRSAPLLWDLATRDLAPGRVLAVAGNPGLDFHMGRERVERGELSASDRPGLAEIRAAIDDLISSGHLAREVEVTGFGPHLLAVVHEDPAAERAFCDLVNLDLDVSRDVLTPLPPGAVTVELPSFLVGRRVKVTVYDADAPASSPAARFVSGARLQVDLPALAAFVTVVVEADPNGLTPPPPPPPSPTFELPFDGSLTAATGEPPLRSVGASLASAGRIGGALRAARSAELTYEGQALNPREGTVSLWIRTDWAGAASGKHPTHGLFGYHPQTWRNELRLFGWSRRVLGVRTVRSENGQTDVYSASVSLAGWSAGVWRHVAATWSASSGELCLYVDGQRVARRLSWRPPLTSGATPIYVGSLPGGREGLEGSLDHLQLFGRALAPAQVAQLASSPSLSPPPPPSPPPVGPVPTEIDPREGSVLMWVRPRWSGETQGDHPSHGLFGFQPRPWRDELRVYVWKRRVLSIRGYRTDGSGTKTWAANASVASWRAGTWRHVAATWSASAAELKLYVDGAPAARVSGWRPPSAQRGEAPLLWGTLRSGATDLGGDLERIRVLERAVTEGEVKAEAAQTP